MSIKNFRTIAARDWVVAFVLIFIFQSEPFSQVANKTAADLWSKFHRFADIGDNHGAYFAMKELCSMDNRVGSEDKFSRWSYCANRHLDDALCVSDSAINDETRFILGMNCKIVMKEELRNVRFGRSSRSNGVDYVGIAYKVSN